MHRITSASLRRYKKKKKKKKNEIRQQRTCKIRRGRIIIKSGRAVSGVYTADELRPDIVTSTRGGRQKIYTIKKVKAKRRRRRRNVCRENVLAVGRRRQGPTILSPSFFSVRCYVNNRQSLSGVSSLFGRRLRALEGAVEQGGVLVSVVERADDGVVVERHLGHLELRVDHHLRNINRFERFFLSKQRRSPVTIARGRRAREKKKKNEGGR